ncbi:MAG: glycosyl transferase family protein [Chloroflexi bacterium]|nr:glycosyl transferase family protein [Chloroflexota bacterium]
MLTRERSQTRARQSLPVQRILLLGLLPLGDTLFALPTIQALRARYPQAHITMLARLATAPLLRHVPSLDSVAVFPAPGNRIALPDVVSRLRQRRFDVAVNFTSPAYSWIGWACGIRKRTEMKFDPLWWLMPGDHARWRSMHAAQHYYECADELDLPPWVNVSHVPHIALSARAHEAAKSFLAGHGVMRGARPIIGMHAGGAWLGGLKRWPAARFALLAHLLQRLYGARIVLVGDSSDTQLVGEIATPTDERTIDAAGKLPLPVSLAMIAACDLFIGNDSGLLHAAAALGTPYVGLLGPTSPTNYSPLARYPDQGILVTPVKPCRMPHYFVGGAPLWRLPCCHGTCRALNDIPAEVVLHRSVELLQKSHV